MIHCVIPKKLFQLLLQSNMCMLTVQQCCSRAHVCVTLTYTVRVVSVLCNTFVWGNELYLPPKQPVFSVLISSLFFFFKCFFFILCTCTAIYNTGKGKCYVHAKYYTYQDSLTMRYQKLLCINKL